MGRDWVNYDQKMHDDLWDAIQCLEPEQRAAEWRLLEAQYQRLQQRVPVHRDPSPAGPHGTVLPFRATRRSPTG